GIACYVLYHMLRGIDVDEVFDAIRSTEPRQIALAAIFVSAGYFTLTFYDWFAVRAIGRTDVPYRVNALAAFTSYSIGHNVGASVFTGGAVRYRIYSAYGLNAIDVAKICFLAGLTFWLGNAAVLGLGITYHPEAAASIDQLPAWLNRAVAILIIIALVAYVVWVWKEPRVEGPAVGRPRPLDRGAARRPLALAADRDRDRRSRLLPAGDVRAGAGRAESRLCRGRGHFRVRNPARLCQPLPRWPRRVRRRHAGRPVADGPGGSARRHAFVPYALLYLALRHICNLADVSGGYPRRSIQAPARGRSARARRWSAA